MKQGDLVRCTYRDLIYVRRGGSDVIGALGEGELVLFIDDNEKSYNAKILHPVYGPGFVTRYYIELVE